MSANSLLRAIGRLIVGLALLAAGLIQPAPAYAQDNAVTFIPVPGSGFDFRLSPDGHTAATYELGVLQDGWEVRLELLLIRLFDVSTGKSLGTLGGATDYTNAVAFTGDGAQMVSMHQNGVLTVWDVATRKQVTTIDTGMVGVGRIQFFPAGRTLVFGVHDIFRPRMLLLDTESGAITGTLLQHFDSYAAMMRASDGGRRQNSLAALAISPDGATVAASTMIDHVWLWDVASGEGKWLVSSEQELPMFSIRKLAFTPDGQRLVYFNSFKDDSKLHVWNLSSATESEPLSIGGPFWALAPDGDTVAWVNRKDTTVQIAKISAPDDVTTIELGVEVGGQPAIEFTADGNRVVVGLWKPGGDEPINGLYVVRLGGPSGRGRSSS